MSDPWPMGACVDCGQLPHRTSGLGKPIDERPHFIVRVFYGGPDCEESLEGPFADQDEANAGAIRERKTGNGAVVYHCVNAKLVIKP